MVNKPQSSRRAAGVPPVAPAGGARRRRSRGRPRAGHSENVREALLEAARELFLRYGFRAVSSRQVAAAAGANVAMIRYYFGGKEGLYREMLESILAPLRSRIDAMVAREVEVDLGGLIAGGTRTWAANPWMVGLVLREVLPPDGPLRPMFLKEVAGRLAPLVESLVRDEIERGRLRSDLDPELIVLSMVSLAAFPFLAYQLTSRLFGVRLDEAFAEQLAGHIREVLYHGLAPRAGHTEERRQSR